MLSVPTLLTLKQSLFVSVYQSEGTPSLGFHLTREQISPSFLEELKTKAELKWGPGPWKIKAVGTSAELVSAFQSLFNDSRYFEIQNEVIRADGSELVFFPETGKIRVQKLEEAKPPAKTRVLIVDDSRTIHKVLTQILSADPEIEVVGNAELPSQALQLLETLKPDVITLDIHMPEMDGVTLLRNYLPKHPIPTVMISSISMEEGPQVLQALELGAVDYIQKPSFNEIPQLGPLIIEKIKAAAAAKVKVGRQRTHTKRAKSSSGGVADFQRMIAIGSSTGGTEALKEVLTSLPDQIPPILIVQHIPPIFSKAFADRMNQLCPFEVREAQNGDVISSNLVLIAPGGKQMKFKKVGSQHQIVITDDAPVNRHKPSVDYLFNHIAETLAPITIGAILTGMGADGAKGLLKMKQAGSPTIAQDEASCVVFGMPREAIKIGAADHILPLQSIASKLVQLFQKKSAA